MFIIIYIMITGVIPFALFYYESDDGKGVGMMSRTSTAFKYTAATFGKLYVSYTASTYVCVHYECTVRLSFQFLTFF